MLGLHILLFALISLLPSAAEPVDVVSPDFNYINPEDASPPLPVEDPAKTDQVVALLKMTKAQLPSGEQFLAGVLTKAVDEIVSLQNQLANCHRVTNCPGKPKTTTPVEMPTTSTPTTPIPKVNYTMTFCDFEGGNNCGFNQTQVNDTIREWSKGQGRQYSGPQEDHTFGVQQGHYMYIDTYKAAIWFKRESLFYIESPLMQPSHHYCIKFWYYMNGVDTQNLRVYAKIANGRGLGYPVWTRSGPQEADWILGEVELGREYTSTPFSIVFEATTMSYYEHIFASHPRYHDTHGYISLDDFYTFTARCSDLPECPAGSHYRHGPNRTSCYTVQTQARTWTEANLACKHQHPSSHLVSVDSSEEQKFIVHLISSDTGYNAAGQSGIWTSGNDQEDKVFRWTGHGNPRTLNYTNWAPGQPNDVGGHQDCLLLQYPDEDYQWGDVECRESHPFICEVDLVYSV